MDRDQVAAVTKAETSLLAVELTVKIDLILKRLENQQEAIEELTEKINDAMIDRYGTGYSQG